MHGRLAGQRWVRSEPDAGVTVLRNGAHSLRAETAGRKFDDPRSGRTTYEMEDLILGDPDPSLFVAPAGYVVEPTWTGL
jgi:hypothetical protein